MFQDVRYGVRALLKKPVFTVVAIVTLALGIGATTAIFSVVNSVLLRPLAYGDPDRLAMVWMDNTRMNVPEDIHSYPNYVDYRDQNQTFEHLATYSGASVNLIGEGEPERIIGTRSSANLYDVLRVEPILGRFYGAEEEEPGHDNVVVLGYGLWQRRFGGDKEVLGRSINMSDTPRVVIGVMPEGFKFPHQDAEFWTPMAVNPQRMGGRGSFGYYVIGRMRPGVTIEQARADMGVIAANLQTQYPQDLEGYGVNVVPLHRQVVGNVRPTLIVLLGAVGFVLLIACANVANLLLARGASREREIAVRTALGAGRRRLIRQLLTESALLAVSGGVIGLLLAFWGLRTLIAISPRDLPRLEEIRIDWRVLVFALVVSLATGLLFGIAPALHGSKTDLNEALKEGTRTSSGVHGKRLRGALVIAEISLSLILLIGAGLLIKSFLRMQEVDMGFKADHLLTINLQLTRSRYQGTRGAEFYRNLITQVEGLPGVVSAGATTAIFISGLPNSAGFSIEGRPQLAAADQVEAPIDFVTAGYFRTMGIPLIRGRELTEDDNNNVTRVVIINKTFAERFWPDEDPLGKRITFGSAGPNAQWLTIVGIVGDMRRTGYDAAVRCETFLPYTQRGAIGFMTLAVRTAGDPQAMFPTVRDVIHEIDRDQPLSQVRTIDQMLSEMSARRRLNMVLMGILAGVALLLAAVGIYGVMSYNVSQRTREIGVRIALGAQSGQVFGLVLRHGAVLTLVGLVLGVVGAYVVSKILLAQTIASLLYQVGETDPWIFASVPAFMAAVAIVACLIPARRATSVDPISALRYE